MIDWSRSDTITRLQHEVDDLRSEVSSLQTENRRLQHIIDGGRVFAENLHRELADVRRWAQLWRRKAKELYRSKKKC